MTTSNLVGGETSVPDDPADLSRADYVAALKRALREIKDDDVPGLAAGVAFKIFLALFPALLAAVAIFTIVTTVSELQEWLAQAEGFLPEDAIAVIDRPLANAAEGDGGGAGFAAVTGVLAGLWAATSAAVSLMKALSRAYDVQENRKFVKQRLVALALTIALVVALVGVIILLVLGPQLQSFLLGEVRAPITWALGALRLVLAFGVLVVLFAFVYWLGPNRDQPSWVWMSPGALFGVVGWLLVSGAFTLYAQTAGSYEATYGAIAGVVVLLVWLQLSMLVILVGAEFNAEVERARSLRIAVGEGAGFAAPAATSPMATGEILTAQHALEETETAAHTVEAEPALAEAPPSVAPAVKVSAPAMPPTAAAAAPAATADSEADTAPLAGLSSSLAAVPEPARKVGAVTAAVMAGAVFLGFARRRAQR